MKYRPKIGGGDFDTKTRKVEHFLAEGHKVKVTLTFRGREVYHPELGKKILDQVEAAVKDVGRVEIFPRIDGRNMTMVLAPDKRAQAAAQKAAAAAAAEAEAGPGTPTTSTPIHHERRPGSDRDRGPGSGPHRDRSSRGDRSDRRGPCGHRCRRGLSGSDERDHTMPKMKTHRGAAKRFKITGTGKLRRLQVNNNHILEKKAPKRKRRLAGETDRRSWRRRPDQADARPLGPEDT